MATVSWSTLQSWIQKNTHGSNTLTPYTPSKQTIHGTNDYTEHDGRVKTQVSPSTPLSAILFAQDTYYTAIPDSARRSILRDETTDLQEKAQLLLKGRAWPINKTAQGIATVCLEEGLLSSWLDIGWRALSILRECQIILINESKKSIRFFPEDVRAWSSDIECLLIDEECRFLWSKPTIPIILWLSEHETNGWTIKWPRAEGTLKELQVACEKINESAAGKRKETLQVSVGRGQSIQTLVSLRI